VAAAATATTTTTAEAAAEKRAYARSIGETSAERRTTGKFPGKPMSRVGRAVSALRRRPSGRSRLAGGPGGRPMARAKVRPRTEVPPRRESSARRVVAPHAPGRCAAENGYTRRTGTAAGGRAGCQEKRSSCGKQVVPPPIHLILFFK